MAGYFDDLDPNKGGAAGQVVPRVIGSMADAVRNPQAGPAITSPAPREDIYSAAPARGGFSGPVQASDDPYVRQYATPQYGATIRAIGEGVRAFGAGRAGVPEAAPAPTVEQAPPRAYDPRFSGATAGNSTSAGPISAAAARAPVAAPAPAGSAPQTVEQRYANLKAAGAITPEVVHNMFAQDRAMWNLWNAEQQARAQAAPAAAVARPQPSPRNRTAQLAASAPTEPVIGALNDATGTYYQGNGMWASEKPLSGEQLAQQRLSDENWVRARRLAEQWRGDRPELVPHLAGQLFHALEAPRATVDAARLAAEASKAGHEISGQATMGAAGIAAGASRYHADKAAAATIEAAKVGKTDVPHPVGVVGVADPITGVTTKTLTQYGIPLNDGTGRYKDPMTGKIYGDQPAAPSAEEVNAALRRAGPNQQQRAAIAAKLRGAGIDPAQYGLK